MLPFAFLSVAIGLIPIVNGATVFIDQSCKNIQDWEDYWNDALDIADMTVQRLDSSTDTDFARIFKRIMQIDKGDNSRPHGYDFIRAKFDAVNTLVDITPNAGDTEDNFWDALSRADIRFFCDNGDLTAPTANLGSLNFYTPGRWYQMMNGLGGGFMDYFVDYKNAVKSSFRRCPPGAFASTTPPDNLINLSSVWPDRGQSSNPNRRVVTICNHLWESSTLKVLDRNLGDPSFDLVAQGIIIDDFMASPSATILHELFHCLSDDIIDTHGRDSYGWQNVLRQTQDEARVNADNYAILGMWALVADIGRGYTMERVRPNDDESKKRETDGNLSFYNDLSRRALLAARYIGKPFSA